MLKLLYRFPYPHLAVYMVLAYLFYLFEAEKAYYLLPIALFYFPDTQASESLQRKINTFFTVIGTMLITFIVMYGLAMYTFKLIDTYPF